MGSQVAFLWIDLLMMKSCNEWPFAEPWWETTNQNQKDWFFWIQSFGRQVETHSYGVLKFYQHLPCILSGNLYRKRMAGSKYPRTSSWKVTKTFIILMKCTSSHIVLQSSRKIQLTVDHQCKGMHLVGIFDTSFPKSILDWLWKAMLSASAGKTIYILCYPGITAHHSNSQSKLCHSQKS